MGHRPRLCNPFKRSTTASDTSITLTGESLSICTVRGLELFAPIIFFSFDVEADTKFSRTVVSVANIKQN